MLGAVQSLVDDIARLIDPEAFRSVEERVAHKQKFMAGDDIKVRSRWGANLEWNDDANRRREAILTACDILALIATSDDIKAAEVPRPEPEAKRLAAELAKSQAMHKECFAIAFDHQERAKRLTEALRLIHARTYSSGRGQQLRADSVAAIMDIAAGALWGPAKEEGAT